MPELIECTLTGFKGDFEAVARLRRSKINGHKAYTIESLCGDVSITVYSSLVFHKLEQSDKPEFYYS